jgi:hypothetical protein
MASGKTEPRLRGAERAFSVHTSFSECEDVGYSLFRAFLVPKDLVALDAMFEEGKDNEKEFGNTSRDSYP